MLSKDQASSIAADLLSQEHQRSIDAWNAAAKRVPMYYQVKELNLLQPYERAEIISSAQRRVSKEPMGIALIVIYLATVICLIYFSSHYSRPAHLIPSIFLVAAIMLALRAVLVRSKIRSILKSRNPSKAESSSSVA